MDCFIRQISFQIACSASFSSAIFCGIGFSLPKFFNIAPHNRGVLVGNAWRLGVLVNECQLSGWVIINGDGGCRRTHNPISWLGLRVGSRLAMFYIHQMNRVNFRNDLCHMKAPQTLSPVLLLLFFFTDSNNRLVDSYVLNGEQTSKIWYKNIHTHTFLRNCGFRVGVFYLAAPCMCNCKSPTTVFGKKTTP